MKKIIMLLAVVLLSFDGCKTHQSIQVERSQDRAEKVDSIAIKRDSIVKDSSALNVQVKKQSEVVEEYKETSITIIAADSKDISIPGTMHLDSTSSLDSLKYSNDKIPKTSLNIYKPSRTAKKSVATLTTPAGKQTFSNWKSITISSKEYKRTSSGKSDSLANSLITHILKNNTDSGHKSEVSTLKVKVNKSTVKESKVSASGLIAAFWWIPATLAIVAILFWKGNALINLFKRK